MVDYTLQLKYHSYENVLFFVTTNFIIVSPTGFGWNIYYDPRNLECSKDGNILLQEGISARSTTQQLTSSTVLRKERESRGTKYLKIGNAEVININEK